MKPNALEFERVTRRFRKVTALDAVDLRIEPGTVLGVVGRNGAGKTTALQLAHGWLYPDTGSIRVAGLDPVTRGPVMVQDVHGQGLAEDGSHRDHLRAAPLQPGARGTRWRHRGR